MIEKDDWRLRGQEKYLKGATLYRTKYTPSSKTWGHDHCEFCWAEFSLESCPDSLQEGWTTEDNYHWICKQCFEDLKELFVWKVDHRH